MNDPAGVRFDKPGAAGRPWLPEAPTPAGPADAPTYELASWGRRALAAFIDAVVAAAITALIVVAVAVVVFSSGDGSRNYFVSVDDDGTGGLVVLLLALSAVVVLGAIVSALYAPIWMWRTNGRTLGKQMLGIRVVRADGAPMSFGFAVFREFLVKGLLTAVVSTLTAHLYLLADILWPLVDSERRALHDHIARTRVVRD